MNYQKLNYYIFVFTLVFGVIFYDFISDLTNFSLIDEMLAAILFIYWLLYSKAKRQKEFYIFLLISLFYLIHSLLYPHNVKAAIYTDFILQIKPFIAFYTVYNIGFSFSIKDKQKIQKLCIALAILILPIGLIAPGGGPAMNLFCGHSRYATMSVVLGTTYLLFSKRKRKDLYITLFIYSIGLLSLRSKMFGFYAAFICIIFLWRKIPRKPNLFTLKTILLSLIFIFAIVYVAREKIIFYFITGTENENNMFARPFLYMKAIEILHDYPFLGTGFGSYATFASDKYYSPLYYDYDLYLNYEIGNGHFISDTYFPVFAQFGYIGLILFMWFWKRRYDTAKNNFLQTGDELTLKIVILIIIFFLIESIADSTFTHNRGMCMMMILALCLKYNQNESNQTKNNLYSN